MHPTATLEATGARHACAGEASLVAAMVRPVRQIGSVTPPVTR